MKKLLLSALMGAAAASAGAEIQLDYYRSLDGLTGRDLKQAIHLLATDNVKMLSYGSGDYKTWWGFYVTDRTADNRVIDRYSDDVCYFTTRGASVATMNIEHSFPKSWWGGADNNAYKDLYNLMPCEKTINNHKSNYPMGVVDEVWRTNGVTEVGNSKGESAATLRYWEPADRYKGDFARGYFYMATAYQDFTWSGDQSVRILKTQAYPTLLPWAYELYLKWAKADPIVAEEAQRNNIVELLQGSRNPFVDFPNLAEYVWGDSVGVAFHPLTSVKSQGFTGGGSILPASSTETPEVIFENSFLGENGGCSVAPAPGSSNITVWQNTAEYGWKASGQKGTTKYNTDVALLTPELDLTGYKRAWFSFEHAVNYATAPYSGLTVEARTDGEEPVALTVSRWPLGNKWDFFASGTVDLTPWAGKKVKVGFRYTSDTSVAPVWEVRRFKAEGIAGESAIEFIEQDMLDPEDSMPEEVYTIDGRRLPSREQARGLVIIRRGSKVAKVYIP